MIFNIYSTKLLYLRLGSTFFVEVRVIRVNVSLSVSGVILYWKLENKRFSS
jgi:hypothetical protein